MMVMIVSYSRFDLKCGFDQFFPLLLAFFFSSFPLFSLAVSVFFSALASFPFSFFSAFSFDFEASLSFLFSFFAETLVVFPLDLSPFFIDFSRSLMTSRSLSLTLYFSFHSAKSFLQFSSSSLQAASNLPLSASDIPSHSFLTFSVRFSSSLYSMSFSALNWKQALRGFLGIALWAASLIARLIRFKLKL